MPPRGRSSSSRSRSRSSSSRSRSSGRSGSSRRSSSFSSRSRSSHSTSSHSSNYIGNGYNRSPYKTKTITSRKAVIFARNYKKPIRTKPTFITNNKNLKPTFHHCFKHDYYYFAEDFYDATTNALYKKGYYDENGQYYEDLKLEYSKTETIEICNCEYCGSNEKIDLKNSLSNQTFVCSNCGAILNLNNITTLNTDYYVCDENGYFPNEQVETVYTNNNVTYEIPEHKKGIRNMLIAFGSIWALVFICPIFIIMFTVIATIGLDDTNNSYYNDYTNEYYENEYYDYSLFGDIVYVPEIDRNCTFDGDYYYDNVTDCYFYYNDEIDIPQYQYWYEDFSSQYGNYGWLEYDETEQQWYVEVSYGKWEVVENPPSYFWHTTYENLLNDNK